MRASYRRAVAWVAAAIRDGVGCSVRFSLAGPLRRERLAASEDGGRGDPQSRCEAPLGLNDIAIVRGPFVARISSLLADHVTLKV